jgi:hypothetical protein
MALVIMFVTIVNGPALRPVPRLMMIPYHTVSESLSPI